jgi:hypothetical protein
MFSILSIPRHKALGSSPQLKRVSPDRPRSNDDHGGTWLPKDFGLITFAEFNKQKFQ